MGNVYDKAHELARELKNHPDILAYRAANDKIKGDETAKKMLEDFRKLQYEAYNEKMKNKKLSKETEEKLQSLGSIISMNQGVAAYLQTEMKFGVLWEDLLKILSDSVGIEQNDVLTK